MHAIIYTDGGARPSNPGPAAWGFVVVDPNGIIIHEHSGFKAHATNNEMELTAISMALKHVLDTENLDSVEIYSDSQYSVNSITKWMTGWKLRGWKTGAGEEVKNLELMKLLDTQVQLIASQDIKCDIKWIKGHAGHEFNERVDQLVTSTVQRGSGSTREQPRSATPELEIPEAAVIMLETTIEGILRRHSTKTLSSTKIRDMAKAFGTQLFQNL